MRILSLALAGAAMLALSMPAKAHYDIAPYLVDGQLRTGGQGHDGSSYGPTITTYLYDFGEDAVDPFNQYDPGVNQAPGVGNLPAGAPVRYSILSSLLYWDGTGNATFAAAPAGTSLELWMGASHTTLNGLSGAQTGALVQSVMSDGALHKHFTTSLFAGAANVPGDVGFVLPADGIYAFELQLSMINGSTTYISNPFWIVFNNGLSEEQHDVAGAAIAAVPEPTSLAVLACGAVSLLIRRKKR